MAEPGGNCCRPCLGFLTEAERLEVRHFLDGLLSAPFDVAEVERLWQKSGAQIGVSNADEAMPFVLAEIRDVFVNYRGRGWPGHARP